VLNFDSGLSYRRLTALWKRDQGGIRLQLADSTRPMQNSERPLPPENQTLNPRPVTLRAEGMETSI
jgi:hypothetical protein